VHDQPFYLARRHTGAVAPSLGDVQVWRALRDRLGPRTTWAANGFVTAEFPAADFARLRTHE
jgi:hypothetical protein